MTSRCDLTTKHTNHTKENTDECERTPPRPTPLGGEREGFLGARIPRVATAMRSYPGLISPCPFRAAI